MSGHGEKLTRCKEKAIASLLTAESISEAAVLAGVSESTMLRWMQRPEFAEAYRAARREAVSHAVTRLQQISSEAVDTLRDVMTDAEAKDSARVTAARSVLEMAFRAVELEDIEARLEQVEAILNANAQTKA